MKIPLHERRCDTEQITNTRVQIDNDISRGKYQIVEADRSYLHYGEALTSSMSSWALEIKLSS